VKRDISLNKRDISLKKEAEKETFSSKKRLVLLMCLLYNIFMKRDISLKELY